MSFASVQDTLQNGHAPELKELHMQLEEFFKKGYIRPSVSP
jgi:hypothetical protein